MNIIRIAVAAVGLPGLVFGATLGYTSRHFVVEDDPVVEKVDEILPQSQCGQCDCPGCCPCAEAISCNGEKANCCTPGGKAVMLKIAELLNVGSQPLDGGTQEPTPAWMVAVIDENDCIDYIKCIQAYPVDAVVDTTRAMHMVVSDLCTGRNLCAGPCPTHYISLQPVAETPNSWK